MIQELIPRIIQETFLEIRSQSPFMQSQEPGTRSDRILQLAKNIGRFDGLTDGIDFLDTLEAQLLTEGIAMENHTRAACACLSGSAARWILNNPDLRVLTWINFRNKFKEQFCASKIVRSDLRRFMELKKESSMEVHINKCKALRRVFCHAATLSAKTNRRGSQIPQLVFCEGGKIPRSSLTKTRNTAEGLLGKSVLLSKLVFLQSFRQSEYLLEIPTVCSSSVSPLPVPRLHLRKPLS